MINDLGGHYGLVLSGHSGHTWSQWSLSRSSTSTMITLMVNMALQTFWCFPNLGEEGIVQTPPPKWGFLELLDLLASPQVKNIFVVLSASPPESSRSPDDTARSGCKVFGSLYTLTTNNGPRYLEQK